MRSSSRRNRQNAALSLVCFTVVRTHGQPSRWPWEAMRIIVGQLANILATAGRCPLDSLSECPEFNPDCALPKTRFGSDLTLRVCRRQVPLRGEADVIRLTADIGFFLINELNPSAFREGLPWLTQIRQEPAESILDGCGPPQPDINNLQGPVDAGPFCVNGRSALLEPSRGFESFDARRNGLSESSAAAGWLSRPFC
jgi:hypothetical protein